VFYLCCCEGGFAEGVLSDAQMLFAKPLARVFKGYILSGRFALPRMVKK
jgi:hypothetical protein